MGRVSLYTDEHIGRAVVRGLRQRGVDVCTVVDAGMLGAPDEAHLERARTEGRVVVSHDPDFLRLHTQGVDHAGIAFVSCERPIGQIIQGLMLIYALLDADEMRRHVEFL
jgi:predicted nuclease of predicted toxin-antitoxin system